MYIYDYIILNNGKEFSFYLSWKMFFFGGFYLRILNFVRHTLFYKQHVFSSQSQRCLTFSWIQLKMLLRCCLIHITIIILRNIFNIFGSMSRPNSICLIFITFNYVTLLKHTHLFSVHFLVYLLSYLDDNVDEESK